MADESPIPEMPADDPVSKTVPDIGRFLFGSRQRIAIFRDIQQGVYYSDLTDKYGDSLTSETWNSFKNKNIATKTEEGRVELTPIGEFIIESYGDLIRDLRDLKEVNRFFDAISTNGYQILDEKIISNGETLSGSIIDKNAVIGDYIEEIRDANRIKEIVPRLIRAGLYDTNGDSIYRQQIMAEQLECTFIHTSEVVNIVSDIEQRKEAQEHQETDQVTYWEYDGDFPFTLTIFDDQIVTMLVDDPDGVKVLFKSESEKGVNWAINVFEEYKQESNRISY